MTENDSNIIPQQVDNLIGQRFGKLTVVAFVDTTDNSHARWRCRCACGSETIVFATSLKTGNTKSCGCLRSREGGGSTTHGMYKTQVYRSWAHMKERCYRKEHRFYSDYGGRGIKVCTRWRDAFENFYADMGDPPDDGQQYMLDRIDNDGNYTPENCRWATYKQQANNKRNNHRITYLGETHTLAQWGRITGIKQGTIGWRIRAGWSVSDALTKKP